LLIFAQKEREMQILKRVSLIVSHVKEKRRNENGINSGLLMPVAINFPITPPHLPPL
jgi:hypothetical protein